MQSREQGLSLTSLLASLLVLGTILLVFFKMIPVYTEYFEVKNALNEMAKTPAEQGDWGLRQDFGRRASVGDIRSVRAQDLRIIAPPGALPQIAVTWRREVPLVSNVSLVFDFNVNAGNTAGSKAP